MTSLHMWMGLAGDLHCYAYLFGTLDHKIPKVSFNIFFILLEKSNRTKTEIGKQRHACHSRTSILVTLAVKGPKL